MKQGRVLTMAAALVAAMSLSAQEAKLPVTKDLKLWLTAQAGLTKDDTGKVSTWESQVEPKVSLLQKYAAKQPVVVADAMNGLPAVRLDGKNDSLVSAALPEGFSGNCTVVVVWGSTLPQVNMQQGGKNNRLLSAPTSTGADYVSGIQLTTGTKDPTAPRLISRKFKDRPQLSFLGIGGMVDGKNGIAGGFHATGDVAEVLIYGAHLNDADLAAVTKYLQEKYKIQ